MAASPINVEDADVDPVINEYDVYMTPEQEEQLYLLQYVNRSSSQPFSRSERTHPYAMRIKEKSGFVEVDVSMNIHQNFNRPMGVKWGEAIRKTKGYGQKAWGFAGGFERAQPPRAIPNKSGPSATTATTAPQPAAEEEDHTEDYLMNFEDADEKGHVLNTQTLGGQILQQADPNAHYVVGTFRGNELHFTKLAGIVQMRNQFTYLDAVSQLEAQARKREKESQEGAKSAEPRAVLVQQKRANENPSVEKARQFLQNTYEEKWTKVRYVDAEAEEAYSVYDETLFIHDTSPVPQLHSSMSQDQYLEAVSAPSRDRMGRKKSVGKQYVELSDTSDDEAEDDEVRKHSGTGGSDESKVVDGVNAPDAAPAGEEMDLDPKV